MADHEDSRVDALRQQLRSLGYLDAGVDRFVLGSARARRRPVSIAVRASTRIGILAALLAGPAAAIGIAGRVPGLITGPRDGFVVALYMGALFGAGLALLSLVAILMVSWLAGRGESWRRWSALAAGFIVMAASLAYLTRWWDVSSLSPHTGTWPGLWTTIGLAFVAAVSLLIGHAVLVASLAVAIARGEIGTQRPGIPGTSRRVVASAGLLTFGAAIALFNSTSGSRGGPVEVPALTVVSNGSRIRFLAIDGFDPDVARRLAERGRIPSLATALSLSSRDETAASAAAVRSPLRTDVAIATVQFDETQDPARLWTTIATGQTAETHAVRGLETRRVLGVQGTLTADDGSSLARVLAAATDLVRLTRPAIASRDERRVKTLWEVAASAGLQTAVVNWWATWPAPADSGIVVSDRAALRLERGGELDAEIAPAGVYETLLARWPVLKRDASAGAQTLQADPDADAVLRRSAELDAMQLAIAREIAKPTTDLACIYLPGLDLVQHALFAAGDRGPASPSIVAARLAALEAYYEFLDRLLFEALAPGDGEIVMLLTGPGRVEDRGSGQFAIIGGVSNTRAREALARPTDIMPTVLHALGVPISRELPGRPLIELFSVDFARRYPVRDVSTYGKPSLKQAPRGGEPLDREMIERLRSLGYVR